MSADKTGIIGADFGASDAGFIACAACGTRLDTDAQIRTHRCETALLLKNIEVLRANLLNCRNLIQVLRTGPDGQQYERVESRSHSMINVVATLEDATAALISIGGTT